MPQRLESVVERVRIGRSAKAGWDDLLKVVGSLQNGYCSATAILDRFGSAARGTPTYESGTLVGKLLRTLFITDILINPAFRRELQRVLNQGESVHDLQRAIHSGRIEAKHGRSKEELAAISGALTLLTNVVMAWNTGRMQSVVATSPRSYPDGHLSRIAPIAYQHINMKGLLRFRIEDQHNLVERRGIRSQET